jgi:hypothetical protein
MKNSKIDQKARYIVAVVKSVNKSLNYALDIVTWYTITDSEEKAVKEQIQKFW